MIIEAPAFVIVEALIKALQESNGLEFIPLEQRLALIAELSKPVEYLF